MVTAIKEEMEKAISEIKSINGVRLSLLLDDVRSGYFDMTKTNMEIIADCLRLAYLIKLFNNIEVKI